MLLEVPQKNLQCRLQKSISVNKMVRFDTLYMLCLMLDTVALYTFTWYG